MGRVKSNLASRVKKGAMSQAAADAALARVKGALDYSDFKRWVQLKGWGVWMTRVLLDFGPIRPTGGDAWRRKDDSSVLKGSEGDRGEGLWAIR